MRYAWLCHPVTVAGVIVLLVNDHLLKQAWPGFVTGKLSDVAGLLVAPPLLALLFLRRADLAATLATGVLFALVKTTETGAEAASHVWTLVAGPSRVLADPTDLLALPALALAWWVRARSLTAPSSPRLRVLLTAPLALLAVAASGAAPEATSEAVSVEVRGERVIVHTDGSAAWTSADRGDTWIFEDSFDRPPKRPAKAMCVPYQATRCYRVASGRLGVEQSDDGGDTWRLSWSPSRDDHDRLVRQFGDRLPRSGGLAVQGWRGGHVVVVANGSEGILLRDETGSWRRLGRPGEPERATDIHAEGVTAAFLAGCLLFGAAGAGLRRYHRAYLIVTTAACLSFLGFASAATISGVFALITAAMVPTGVIVGVILLIMGQARPLPVAVGVLSAPLVYLTVYLPFVGWADGDFGSYWTAVAVAALLTSLVLAVDLALIRKDAAKAPAAL
ncbi:hypothetical protein SAMN05421811_104132 [Nonomuraea wenchangensis]|uniref:Uncharacterized protein n=1 Tax=Nonomuraea wenchangensis TaxID=568860 RepID=A0A1I0H5J0_9ACTN|nr:hypothetical protein SAMN05421811_104132 [Nonomuraea wenchangensis]